MLDDQLKSQLSAYLERVQQPFELVASLDDSETARDMRELLETIQSLRSDKITLRTDGNDARKPSFSLQRWSQRLMTPVCPMKNAWPPAWPCSNCPATPIRPASVTAVR